MDRRKKFVLAAFGYALVAAHADAAVVVSNGGGMNLDVYTCALSGDSNSRPGCDVFGRDADSFTGAPVNLSVSASSRSSSSTTSAYVATNSTGIWNSADSGTIDSNFIASLYHDEENPFNPDSGIGFSGYGGTIGELWNYKFVSSVDAIMSFDYTSSVQSAGFINGRTFQTPVADLYVNGIRYHLTNSSTYNINLFAGMNYDLSIREEYNDNTSSTYFGSRYIDYTLIGTRHYAFDITAAAIPPTDPGVPEPATWTMMVAGFGLVGGGMRYRVRRRATAI